MLVKFSHFVFRLRWRFPVTPFSKEGDKKDGSHARWLCNLRAVFPRRSRVYTRGEANIQNRQSAGGGGEFVSPSPRTLGRARIVSRSFLCASRRGDRNFALAIAATAASVGIPGLFRIVYESSEIYRRWGPPTRRRSRPRHVLGISCARCCISANALR